MARKEYEMLFSLNAQLNSQFKGTFSKAQQQLISMQKELQEMNKLQADVKAYQKQQQAVEGTQKKLQVLQQQYDNIQREIQETGSYSSDLENKLLSKQQQIEKTSTALGNQTAKLDDLGASLRDAGVNTADLSKESERLGAEMADLRKKQEEAAEGAKDFGESSVSAFEAAANALAAAGLVAGLKKVFEAYQQCIGIAGDFEASMSSVAALSGASVEELDQLSELAKELGATTKFTAKESADAMGYMAMAGWSAEQMLAGMPGVLSLAAASGEDLAAVSDIVTDSLTAFGLSAESTARYADILAATAANSNTTVSLMGETFKTAAPLAGALGYSVEDVATAIGLMANAGIKGSVAGTSLKNIFAGLLDTMTLTGAAFGEVQYSAINADGTMKSFGETLEDLRYYFSQMTGAERLQNAEALVGQRAMSGFVNLMTAADLDVQSLTDSINNSAGAAERMAAIRMDNMTGQLTLLNSAWEAVQNTVGEQFTPKLQELYGAGAEVLGEVNEFLQAHPQLIKAATVLAGGLGATATAILGIAAAAKVLKALNIGSMLVGAAGLTPLGWVAIAAAGVTALATAVTALTSVQDEEEREIASLTAASREQYYQLQELQSEYESVCEAQGEFSADAQLLKRRLDEETAAFENSKETAEDAAKAHQALMDAHADLMASYADQTEKIDRNAESNLNLMNKLIELVNAEEQTAAQKQQILTLVDMLNESLPELALAYDANANALNLTADAIKAIIEAEVERERKSADYENLKEQYRQQTQLLENQKKAIEERNLREQEYNEALAAQAAAKAKVDAAFKDHTSDAYWRAIATAVSGYEMQLEKAKAAWEDAKITAEQATQAYSDNQTAIDTLSAALATYSEDQKNVAQGSIEIAELIGSTTEQIQALTDEYNAAYEAAKSSIEGQYALWDTADKVVAKSAESISSALDSQISYWQDYNTNLAALGDRTDDIDGLREMLASFTDGSKDSVAAVAGMASASDADLKKMVQQWKDLQQAQMEAEDSIAELKTNYSERMQELTEEMALAIQSLDLGDEAAASGRSTIEGFISAASDQMSRVQSAYRALGQAAARALAGNYSNTPNGHGATFIDVDAYASGTDSASPGLAIVGESGPELMMMRGGEQVISAEETAALLRAFSGGMTIASATPEAVGAMLNAHGGAGYQITVPISINIEGNATPETVDQIRDAVADLQNSFAERVQEVIEETAIDKARRAYR